MKKKTNIGRFDFGNRDKSYSRSITEDATNIVTEMARSKCGIGRICRRLSRFSDCQNWSSLAIFRFVIYALIPNKFDVQKRSIKYHFNMNVKPEDYDNLKSLKEEILDDILSIN